MPFFISSRVIFSAAIFFQRLFNDFIFDLRGNNDDPILITKNQITRSKNNTIYLHRNVYVCNALPV